MKKIILALAIIVMISTPCFAEEVEPDGIFSVDGTLWGFCKVGFLLNGFEFIPIMDCNSFGFYQGRAYRCQEGYCSEADDMFYVDLGVVTITYTFVNGLAIMQPTIGLGVYSMIQFWPLQCDRGDCSPPGFIFEIGIMNKINDNWAPPINIHLFSVWGSSGADVFALGFDNEAQSTITAVQNNLR